MIKSVIEDHSSIRKQGGLGGKKGWTEDIIIKKAITVALA